MKHASRAPLPVILFVIFPAFKRAAFRRATGKGCLSLPVKARGCRISSVKRPFGKINYRNML